MLVFPQCGGVCMGRVDAPVVKGASSAHPLNVQSGAVPHTLAAWFLALSARQDYREGAKSGASRTACGPSATGCVCTIRPRTVHAHPQHFAVCNWRGDAHSRMNVGAQDGVGVLQAYRRTCESTPPPHPPFLWLWLATNLNSYAGGGALQLCAHVGVNRSVFGPSCTLQQGGQMLTTVPEPCSKVVTQARRVRSRS